MSLDELVSRLPDQARELYSEHRSKMLSSPGSSSKHQAWPGGYADHVTATCDIAEELYSLWSSDERRPLSFELDDALLVLFLHDLEKPFKYSPAASPQEAELQKLAREDPSGLKDILISRHGIELSAEQRNALRYIHGEPDSEYSPEERLAGRLAAFCHCCDYLSARLWFDQPDRG